MVCVCACACACAWVCVCMPNAHLFVFNCNILFVANSKLLTDDYVNIMKNKKYDCFDAILFL